MTTELLEGLTYRNPQTSPNKPKLSSSSSSSKGHEQSAQRPSFKEKVRNLRGSFNKKTKSPSMSIASPDMIDIPFHDDIVDRKSSPLEREGSEPDNNGEDHAMRFPWMTDSFIV
jgi:hypothetical protein